MPDSTPLDATHARHLLRRTGFGAPPDQVVACTGRTRGAVVGELLAYKPQGFKPGGSSPTLLHAKWIKFMLKTKSPLQEKLVLFWHDHFATGISKVIQTNLMGLQNKLFRVNGKGNFRTLMKAVNVDPAMVEYLDTTRNEKTIPNENYARELMELFTLGVNDESGNPNYTQDDIVQIARAFTGWRRHDKDVNFEQSRHDFNAAYEGPPENRGPKDIFKSTGGFGASGVRYAGTGSSFAEGASEIDTVIDILLAHTDTDGKVTVARRLARRLIEYFAHPEPSLAYVDDVVATSGFGASWNIAALLHAIFVHDDFYLSSAPAGAGTKKSVKWPADLVVSSLRLLKGKLSGKFSVVRGGEYRGIADHLTNMGQILFDPPSVFGWDWETGWLSSATLLARYTFASDVAASSGSNGLKLVKLLDLDDVAADAATVVDAVTDLLGVTDDLTTAERNALIDYLTDGSPATPVNLTDYETREKKVSGLLGLVMQSPSYHVH
jgi:uncharacterized protein (DUF1800 family)